MGAGFYHRWPDACTLTADDRARLGRGGVFLQLRVDGRGPPVWEERKADASFTARFEEVEARPDAWVAVDRARGLHLEIPRAGGTSRLSHDGGATWTRLYEVTAPLD